MTIGWGGGAFAAWGRDDCRSTSQPPQCLLRGDGVEAARPFPDLCGRVKGMVGMGRNKRGSFWILKTLLHENRQAMW